VPPVNVPTDGEYEQQAPGYVSPAANLMSIYATQVSAAAQALQILQQNRVALEVMPDCPDTVLEQMDDLEISITNTIDSTGQLLGAFNQWAKSGMADE